MRLLPTASSSSQQKSSCSAMGFVGLVICESWAAQTQGILLKILWARHQHECLQHEHFQLCFCAGNRKEEGNKCNRRNRTAEWDNSRGDRKQFITDLRVFPESSVLQVCPTALHPDTQAHQHSKLFGATSPILGCGNVSTSHIHSDLFLCLELDTGSHKIQVSMTRKKRKCL